MAIEIIKDSKPIPTVPSTKPKLVLVENSISYDLVIPGYVENKIRHLCSRVHDIEWSGILFYTVEGNFKDENFKATCLDILPMDIGTATFTNFKDNADVIAYRLEHPELMNENVYEALIHSHNNMSAFFSGTDVSTLQEEGEGMPHFLSLIVNNAGKYVARVTRRVHSHMKIEGTVTTTVSSFYDSFGNTAVPLKEAVVEDKEISEETDTAVLEYYNLNIIKEEGDYSWTEIDDRLDTIKKGKYNYSSGGYSPGKYPGYGGHNSFQGTGGPSKTPYYRDYEYDPYHFYDDEYGVPYSTPVAGGTGSGGTNSPVSVVSGGNSKKLSPKYDLIRKAVIRLLTMSFISDTEKTTAYEAANQIDALVVKEFGTGVSSEKAFEECVNTMVDYVVVAYQDEEFINYMIQHPEELPEELSAEGEIIAQDAPAIMAWYIVDYLKGLKQGKALKTIIESLKLYYELQ